ncbi:MAG: hypothetical protein U0610_08755 [bacterium]
MLASLVTYGLTVLRFDLPPAQVAITVGAALASQVVLSSAVRVPRLELKSALISSLSLCLLLRPAPALAGRNQHVADRQQSSAIRMGDKHVFNSHQPGARRDAGSERPGVDLVGAMGNTAIFAAALALAGLLVVQRSARSDVTVAFLATYVALVFGRSAWLGEPMAIPLHRLESGALVLFAFFMISDLRTTLTRGC